MSTTNTNKKPKKNKYKVPNYDDFLSRKRYFAARDEPIWVKLEREMRENVDKKPYNKKVGEWLTFLRDLKLYKRCEANNQRRQLKKAIGPRWYIELSSWQREALSKLKDDIHKDLLEDLPVRTRVSLNELGLTIKIPKKVLMKTMAECHEEPGVFIWNLYTAIYNHPPSELQKSYDLDEQILMSALVFIDMDEFLKTLDEHTEIIKDPPKPKPKVKKNISNNQTNVRYGSYLENVQVPCYSPKKPKTPWKPPQIKCKIKLRSAESYEELIQDESFLEKRIQRTIEDKVPERVCDYKFWEPPSSLRNTDPKKAAYVEALKMFKLKARAKYMKYKAPYDNIQFHIGTVCYTGGKAHFQLNSLVTLPTGFIPLNGGVIKVKGEYITHILGMWKYPRDVIDKCESKCTCLAKWEEGALNHFKESKCKCGHYYDFGHQGKPTEKFFHPPTKYSKYWMDYAKVYQLDPTEDFILDTVVDALRSTENTPSETEADVSAQSLKNSELLQAFLGDLADTPLIIPHLPEAHLIDNFTRWVGDRVKGPMKKKARDRENRKAIKSWGHLDRIDFKANAYTIPITPREKKHLTWAHKNMLQQLQAKQQADFIYDNRLKLVECSRMWWPTMKFGTRPLSQAFIDTFFTYMSGRMKDYFCINPYSVNLPRVRAKTCPLNL